MAQIKLAEYTFDNSVGDCLPTLRLSSIEMTTEDIVSGVVTRRTVYIDDTTLPYRLYFQNQTALLTVDYLHIGSNITDLSSMFSGCTKLKTVNTTNWNLSSCTNISFMFQNCSSLTKLDLRNWVTGSATTMQGMFHSCSSLTEIKGIENFNVSSVTSFGAMFYLCKSLTKLDLRNWVTRSATSFQDMFASCHNLEVIRVDNFDTSKVTGTGLNGMFSDCKKVKTLNLNSFVNARLGNFLNFCYKCESLEYISAQNFIWGNFNSAQGLFTNCKSLKYLDFTTFDGSNITTATVSLRLGNSLDGVTCPIYYNSNTCTANDTGLTGKSNAIDVKGRLMAVYDFNNTVTTSDSTYPTLTGSIVTNTIDTQGSESSITHRVIGVDVMPTAIKFGGIVTGLLNVDYLAVTNSCTQLGGLFDGCVHLENINTFGWDTSNVQGQNNRMFSNCSQLTKLDMTWFNTSKITMTRDMFSGCSKLTELDLSSFNTENVTSFQSMFNGCTNLVTLNVSSFNTEKCTHFPYMFWGCTSLQELDLTNFNTTKNTMGDSIFNLMTSNQIVYVHDTNWTLDTAPVTVVRRLSKLIAKYTFDNTTHPDCLPKFNGQAGKGTTVDYKVSDMVKDNITTRFLSTDGDLPQHIYFADDFYTGGRGIISCDYLDTSNCTSLYLLFYGCSTLTSVNTSSWDTSKVTSFYCTFFGTRCTEIDCSNIDTSSATSINRMFDSCSTLTSLDLSSWDVSKVTDFGKLFSGCYALKSLNTSGWDTSSAVSMNDMFLGCGLTELDVSHFNTSNVTNLSSMFAGVKIPSIDLSGWDVRKVQQTRLMFNSRSITEIKLDGWNTESLTDMWAMFCDSAITTVDINHFNVSKVTNASQLFDNCQSLVSVDMSNLHFTSCQTISNMFSRCGNLTTLKMADFTGSPLNNILTLCHNAKKLTEIDVSTFDTSRVTNLQNIFSECHDLERIIGIEKWNTSNVTGAYYAFNNCYKISELDLSGWDTRKFSNKDDASLFYSWGSRQEQTVYYEPPYWDLNHKSFNNTANFVIKITRNNGYWLDMTGITGATEITLFNENNLPTEEILTDWGDGTQNSELTHTYSTAGEYVVVSNLQLGQNNNKVNSYLTKAIIYYLTKPYAMFYSCSKLTDVTLTDNWVELFNAFNETNGYACDSMFYGCKKLSTLDTTQICKMKNITSMKYMFSNCSSLVELDLGGFDTSKVTSLQNTFSDCNALTSLNLNGLDLSSVTTMNSMCNNCYGLTTFTPPKNNTNSLKVLQDTFRNTRLSNYDFLNDWNLDQVTSFSSCLHSCTNMTSFSFKNKHLPSTTNLQYMFSGCTNLQTVDLSGLTVDNNVGLLEMFKNCKSLTSVDFSNSTIKPTTCANMFYSCSSLTSLDLSSWDTSQCTNLKEMFSGCSELTIVKLDNWNTSKVTNMEGLFESCYALKNIDLSSFTTESKPYMPRIFMDVPVRMVDLSNIIYYDGMNMAMFRWNSGTTEDIIFGMLYTDAKTINKLVEAYFNGDNGTNPVIIYYQDADPSQLTPVEGVTFKKYQNPTTIQLPPHIQLHSLPDGTRDEVDIKTGILTRNVGFIVLDGTEEWNGAYTGGANPYYETKDNVDNCFENYQNSVEKTRICVSYPFRNNYDALHSRYAESLGITGSKVRIVISTDRVKDNWYASTELRKWLKENPQTITYTLKTPTTEQLILNYNNSCDYGRILPTGMCDKYDVVNSMYTQTMTSILLDGENTWDAMEEFENTVKFTATGTTVGVEELNMLGAGGLYCDNDLFPNINDDSDVPHCRVDEAGNKFYIYVDKEMLMSPDLIGWQIWLQANKFNLIYELAEHLTYVKPYEELDAVQARWEGMDCMRDGAINYHTNSSDNITIYPTLEYVAPSINNFEVPMLEPNTDYTIYAEGINENDTINLGGNDINFNNGTVYTSGNNQWLRIDNNDSFYNVVITKGDTTGEVVPYFEGMTSVENPKVNVPCKNLFMLQDYDYVASWNGQDPASGKDERNVARKSENGTITFTSPSHGSYASYNIATGEYFYSIHGADIDNYDYAKTQTMVEGAGTYTIQLDVNYMEAKVPEIYVYYDDDKKATYHWRNGNDYSLKLTVEKKINFIAVSFWYEGGIVNLTISNIQVEKGEVATDYVRGGGSTVSYTDLKLRSLPNGVKDTINVVTGEYIQRVGEREYQDGDLTNENVLTDGINTMYELENYIITKLDPQTLLAYTDGTINLSSDTGFLPTTHYTVPSTNTFHLPSMKTGTRYTLKYPSASGSITIGDINYSISSDSMLFTTPLKINGDTSAIIFSDTNPENVVLLEGAYNKREVPFFTGVKSVKNPNITIIDQLSTESTTYNCETEIELRGLPNGVADKLDIIKGKLTTNVGIRPYQEGDENLPNIWTDGYETVYALSSPVVTNVTIDRPTVTTNSLIDLTSDYLIPQLNYRAPSSNNFPLDLLQPNQTYTLYADTLTSGSYILGGTRTGVYSQPHTIILGDMTDNLLTFNGDLGLSNVMLVKGNSLKTTLPPYFLGIRSVTDGHLSVEGMAGEMNELTFDEGIILRDCNGVKDTIDLITCTLTKRTGEITLTGAEGWYRADNESTTDYNVFKLTLGGLKEALVMCDTLQSVFDTKMMDCIHAHTNELCIVIANATIGGNTVNALKSWLNQHPTTVVYQLRTPIEVQLENTWTTLPPTSYNNQTEISSTVSTNSLKPMISVTIATTTLEEIVSNLEAQNAQLEEENMATMLALTSVYETLAAPMAVATMSLDDEVSTANLSDDKNGNNINGMSVSPIGMVYVNLIRKGLKTINQVPYNLQAEVMYALRGME